MFPSYIGVPENVIYYCILLYNEHDLICLVSQSVYFAVFFTSEWDVIRKGWATTTIRNRWKGVEKISGLSNKGSEERG